ncbi:hypothetical protein [Pedobacter panaciterrae]
MKNKFIIAIATLFVFSLGCKSDSDYLDIKPTQVLSPELAFSDPTQVLSILADLYNRQYDYPRLTEWVTFGDFNESFYSENGQYNNYHGNSTGALGDTEVQMLAAGQRTSGHHGIILISENLTCLWSAVQQLQHWMRQPRHLILLKPGF